MNRACDISRELSNAHHEEAAPAAEAPSPATAAARRRRNASAGAGDFVVIQLEPAAAARRETEVPRPPPTLPRMYIELEPRQLADADVPLIDYADEPVGLLSDFHVAWRLQVLPLGRHTRRDVLCADL